MPSNKETFGIGDTIMSPLTLAQFQAEHGGQANDWVLCDGGRYPGSAYAQLMGRDDVPDLRSRYPRGADGSISVLTMLEPSIANHTHQLSGWGIMNDCRGGGDNQVLRTGYGGDTVTSGVREDAVIAGGETRPRTTVVNFFIRIN